MVRNGGALPYHSESPSRGLHAIGRTCTLKVGNKAVQVAVMDEKCSPPLKKFWSVPAVVQLYLDHVRKAQTMGHADFINQPHVYQGSKPSAVVCAEWQEKFKNSDPPQKKKAKGKKKKATAKKKKATVKTNPAARSKKALGAKRKRKSIESADASVKSAKKKNSVRAVASAKPAKDKKAASSNPKQPRSQEVTKWFQCSVECMRSDYVCHVKSSRRYQSSLSSPLVLHFDRNRRLWTIH